jgi:hypothetical protein
MALVRKRTWLVLLAAAVLAFAAVAGTAVGGASQPDDQGFERPLQDLAKNVRLALALERHALKQKKLKLLRAGVVDSMESLRNAAEQIASPPLNMLPNMGSVAIAVADARVEDGKARKAETKRVARLRLTRAIAAKEQALEQLPKESESGCQLDTADAGAPGDDFVVAFRCTRPVDEVDLAAINAEIARFGQWTIRGVATPDRVGDCSRTSEHILRCPLSPPLPNGEFGVILVVGGLPPGTEVELLVVSGEQFEILELTTK